MARTSRRRRRHCWADWPNERLLDLRLCDLDVQIRGSPIEDRIEQVLSELEQRGLRFRPYFWISTEWFTPADIPGCAVPFYLLHPRLTMLEQCLMLGCEGASRRECMRILRHESGHALDHAYRLRRRHRRQKLFGKSGVSYPKGYLPEPGSRRYVHHLDCWYAQSHPDEDFAETFAVWLTPRSGWRRTYAGWPALKKLEYMEELMEEIADEKPAVRSRERVEPISGIRQTLRQYYAQKQERYACDYPDLFDNDLRQLFSASPEARGNETAASFLRRVRAQLRRRVARWTGHNEYNLDQVLADIIGRSQQLGLRLASSPAETEIDAAILLSVKTMDFLYGGRRWLDL